VAFRKAHGCLVIILLPHGIKKNMVFNLTNNYRCALYGFKGRATLKAARGVSGAIKSFLGLALFPI
jgi:hypothetical protein